MSAKRKTVSRSSVRELGIKITALEHEAFNIGLPATAKRLNEAAQRLGWEAAEKIDGANVTVKP